MMNAYPACYLSSAKRHLAEAFDYAIRDCEMDGGQFASLFSLSRVGAQFEVGNPWAVAGMSGIELVETLLQETADSRGNPSMPTQLSTSTVCSGRSIPYWVGWSVAAYQWSTARSFSSIFSVADYETLARMYTAYHQADISLFVQDMELRFKDARPLTNLKRMRESRGFSQSQLAQLADVGLRSIQMYEQRNNDIDKAQAAVLYRIARVLRCRIEDLLEDPGQSRYEYTLVSLDEGASANERFA